MCFLGKNEEKMDNKKELKLIIQPKVIDHLGIKMYQKPVDVISEFIANAWDADAENVNVHTDDDIIIIEDDGNGMTFDECQNFFLTVGRDRRIDNGKEVSEKKERPVLGRKGIGKFAGFGISRKIEINTVGGINRENTVFKMDLDQILKKDVEGLNEKPIEVIEYKEKTEKEHGTMVCLSEFGDFKLDEEMFRVELSRRFLLSLTSSDFKIKVNDKELPDNFSAAMEFVFPQDLTDDERKKFNNLNIDDNGWGIEKIDEYEIKWRIGFFEDTIKEEELRGISVFAKGKMAQKPFFFDLSGGISGQNALEYMTGQIQMDFIDEGENNLISTERQRINLQGEMGKKIREWGIQKIKDLSSIWKKRRSEKRLSELEDRVSGFKSRLDKLPAHERKTVKSVMMKIASFPRLGKGRFTEWCSDIITSWETGRLRNLISEISESKDLDENKFLDILSEAGILTSLNIAESIKTKIVTIGELKRRKESRELENSIRDFIYENPWLIHPRWESFKKERSLAKLIEDVGEDILKEEIYNGRIDLALSSGNQLLLIEFMRPGLEIDHDHISRINLYVTELRIRIEKMTGATINRLENAYIIAESNKTNELTARKILEEKKHGILFLTWDALIDEAIRQWSEYLDLLKERFPKEERIQIL